MQIFIIFFFRSLDRISSAINLTLPKIFFLVSVKCFSFSSSLLKTGISSTFLSKECWTVEIKESLNGFYFFSFFSLFVSKLNLLPGNLEN